MVPERLRAALPAARPWEDRAGRAPHLRPGDQDPPGRRRQRGLDRDGRRRNEPRRPREPAAAEPGPGVPLHDPDLPEPDRADADRGAAEADRGARAAAEPAPLRGRSVQPDPLRGRAAAGALRPHGEDVDLQLVLLEDGVTGPAGGLVHPAGGARRGDHRGRGVVVHHPGAARGGDRARVRHARPLRAEPRARERAAQGAARRDDGGARQALLRARPGRSPRAASSRGSSCPRERTPRT